jgi:lysophospholipase L1-like esterase
VVGPFAADDLYGLGGVTFIGRSRASRAEYGTSTKSDFGRAVSRFGVQYLEQPDGGVFEISVDKDAQVIRVQTAAQTLGLKERVIQVPDGEHRFELRVVKAPVRAFGTWMERDVPGVVLDSIGIQGGRMRFLDKSDDAHWAAALQLRNPSLVVFQFGLNESADGFAYPMQRYRETSLAVLQQARKALPKTSCLVIAPNDTAVKKGTSIVSRGVMPHLVKVQRDVSAAAGCAFFNTWEAMGGLGSMPTWYGRGLGQPDLTHPTTIGADIIASWVFSALMDGYASYRATSPEPTGEAAPLAPATASSGAAAGSAAPRL